MVYRGIEYLDLKVLFVTTEYPPYIFGGGGIFAYNLTHSFAKMGINVHVISAFPRTLGKEETVYDDGIIIRRIGIPCAPPRHVWFQILGLRKIVDMVNEVKPDIIHANSFSAAVMFRYLKRSNYNIPLVVTLHGYPRHYLRLSLHSLSFSKSFGQSLVYTIGYPIWDTLLLLEIKYSDAIVTMSRFIVKSLTEDYNVESDKIVYIPNGIDLSLINSIECTYNGILNDSRSKPYLILAGGRLFYEKGIFLIPYIARKLVNHGYRNVLFIIFGDGPYRGFIRNLIKDLNVSSNVVLLGSLPHKIVLKLLCVSDVVLIPSIYELMPMFMLEAMAMKKPIIALKSHYIEDFKLKGIVIGEAENISDMALKIIDIINNISEWRRIAQRNFKVLVREYNISVIAKKYVNVYRSLLQRSLK